ncbi:fatty acid hydroxylase superfamily-domain-containing protein [Russula compacta]|nr:fatty acid hydroxylase superfamily-domain-containing protein [Russula compacta]
MSSSSYNTTTATPPTIPIIHAHPIYYSPAPSLLSSLSDPLLAVLAPLPAYWLTSGLFHLLDLSDWRWLARYRIHDSAEVASRNRVSRLQVLRAVLLQQAIQTALGFVWVSEPPELTDHPPRCAASLAPSRPFLVPLMMLVVLDTWQYFLHRAMHLNRFLFKHLHSVHHRLYVPYAYGALYNHPVEGFLLDSLGAVLSETIARLSVRQTMLFFVLSTCKTVDDHCGYRLPFDPLQMLSGNTADYHDIHHQVIGIKSNFSQPWFVHWDVILGTRMTRREIDERRAKPKTS